MVQIRAGSSLNRTPRWQLFHDRKVVDKRADQIWRQSETRDSMRSAVRDLI
jgi:hypothetical protein